MYYIGRLHLLAIWGYDQRRGFSRFIFLLMVWDLIIIYRRQPLSIRGRSRSKSKRRSKSRGTSKSTSEGRGKGMSRNKGGGKNEGTGKSKSKS